MFVYGASRLSTLCLVLSPVALAIVFWYSLAKRYTAYTQLFLGSGDGGGAGRRLDRGRRPAGLEPWLLGLAIGLWVGGFDILYACQDVEFDRGHGLRSIPTRFGVGRRSGSRDRCTSATVVAMAALWRVGDLPRAVPRRRGVVAILLAYEQSLVSDDDLSQVKTAFDLNGYVGHRLLRGDRAVAVSSDNHEGHEDCEGHEDIAFATRYAIRVLRHLRVFVVQS